MELPGELCNEIYREAVLEANRIRVSERGLLRSGLLIVNKQIHKKCVKIYYLENRFFIESSHYDSTMMLTWTGKLNTLELDTDEMKKVNYTTKKETMRPDWENLIEWLRLYHAGKVLKLPIHTPRQLATLGIDHADRIVLSGLASVVRKSKQHSWSEVEEIPFSKRQALVLLEEEWDE